MTVAQRAVFILALVIFAILTARSVDHPTYNCAIAEFSPDFTPAMKMKCRYE